MLKKLLKSCTFENCNIQPVFNYKTEKIGKFCSLHRLKDMINVKDKTCEFKDCLVQPIFNFKDELKGKFCSLHKIEGMINVKDKTCEFKDCNIRPNFNYRSEKNAIFCNLHKLPKMINIKDIGRSCESKDCNIRAIFNFKDELDGRFCSLHKLKEMVNITINKCNYDKCETTANYNYIGNKKGKFCSKHKLKDMIDLKNKLCEFNNCIKQPIYNFKGEKKRRFCNDHKLENMINVAKKLCEFKDCTLQPSFNYVNENTSRFCSIHKLDNMINILSILCKTPLCYTKISNPQYDGYCLRCFIYTFPDKQVSRNYKTKESYVVDHIKKTFPILNLITDKKIKNGTSKRRPDILLDLEYQIIIIEIDENQHRDYNCSCENKRLMEISKDLNHRNIIFIKFNPDDYINSKGIKINSCWTLNKLGILVVSDTYKNEWNKRLQLLCDQINYWNNPINRTNKILEIIELFYDQPMINNKNDI